MSDIVLYEGGKKRNIHAISDIETDLADGSTCLWMRKDAATFEPIKITTNGIFLAPFAYDEVDVDVQWIIDEYGIDIDDWNFPHITLDDLDLSLDLDGFPDLEGFDLKDLLKDSDFDFDQDFDISLDDFDLHLDNLDTDLTLNLNTLELTETELPDEIRIMHVPTKTSYKDGEEIDIDGLVVQAYRGGEVWEDPDGKYIDGYVPADELIVKPQVADDSYSYVSKIVQTTDKGLNIEYQTNNGVYTNTSDNRASSCFSGLFGRIPLEHNYLHSQTLFMFTIYGFLVVVGDDGSVDYPTLGYHFEKMYVTKQDLVDVYSWYWNRSKEYVEERFDAYIRREWQESQTHPGLYENLIDPFYDSTSPHIDRVDLIGYKKYDDYGRVAYSLAAPIFVPFLVLFGNSDRPHSGVSGIFRVYKLNGELLFTHEEEGKSFHYNDYKEKIRQKVPEIAARYYETGEEPSSECEVTISWPRPKDNKLLTATFDISVEQEDGE